MDKNTNKRKATIIADLDNHKIVMLSDIIFKGKRKITWSNVEEFLKQYKGKCYEIEEYSEKVYIGRDFYDEYTGSNDTARLKGGLAKAKANAALGIPELIRIANNKRYKENFAKKHKSDAKYGWYRYETRFALPVYAEGGNVERYNVFHIDLLVRHDADGKLYLYDMVNIKKETSTPS